MSKNWTPGPWIYVDDPESEHRGGVFRHHGDGTPVDSLFEVNAGNWLVSTIWPATGGEEEANGRLAAAAPELYDALEACVVALNLTRDKDRLTDRLVEDAQRTLAKARGERAD